MSIRDYWQQLPEEQQKVRNETRDISIQAELEAYAAEHHMLIHNGKLIKPEDYPCACEKQSPHDCFEESIRNGEHEDWTREEREYGQCLCPCHRYFEPF